MCVKEFFGYNCGHCSIPYLRQCPLSASNPQFPVCDFPAERPVFTNEYCHPCSRIVWNARVLEEEAEHKQRHLREERCDCETVFEEEVVRQGYADLQIGGGQNFADEWDNMAANRYVGYYHAGTPVRRHAQQGLFTNSLAPEPRATAEYIPHVSMDLRQSERRQNGMKWHTENTFPAVLRDTAGPSKHPSRNHQPVPGTQVGSDHKLGRKAPRTRPSRSHSEPGRESRFKDCIPKLEALEVQAQPVVVSSDMFKYDSK